MDPFGSQAGKAYVKLAEWLENALTARDNRHLQSAAEAVEIRGVMRMEWDEEWNLMG